MAKKVIGTYTKCPKCSKNKYKRVMGGYRICENCGYRHAIRKK